VSPTIGSSKYVAASPVGDANPICPFLRKKSEQRSFTADAPAITLLERHERHAPDQERRHDRLCVHRIVDQNAAPIARELDQFVA